MHKDQQFISRAVELAVFHSADGLHGPFGAVVVREGEIIGEGWNAVVDTRDPTAHAEIMAIRAACRASDSHVLDGCAIYCSCEPCPMCLGAIYWARIPRVVYACTRADAAVAGFDDSFIYDECGRSWTARRLQSEQLARAQGLAVFDAWRDNTRRVTY